jgi:hypothetical protein
MRVWSQFNNLGIDWRAVLAKPNETSYLDEAEGVTVASRARVYINELLPYTRQVATFGHELVHVTFSTANKELVAAVLGCPVEQVTEAEERVAAFIGPQLGSIILSGNMMRLPK